MYNPEVDDVQVVSVVAHSAPDCLELNHIYTNLNGTKVIMKEVRNASSKGW